MISREKMKINYVKMKCTNLHNYAASRAKPGNPASKDINTNLKRNSVFSQFTSKTVKIDALAVFNLNLTLLT